MAISNNESGSSVRTKINASLALTDAITASAAEINQLDGVTLSGNNTGDNAANTTYANAKTITDFLTVTQAVDLDTIESTLATALQPANIVETITNGVTTNAPSENAVFDALALKANLTDLVSVYVTVRNATGSSIAKGKLVYINGATGQNPTIALARANSLSTSRAIGITNQVIANNTTVTNGVTTLGTLDGLDTSAFTDGAQLYISETTAGDLQSTAPSSPNFTVPIAIVLHAHATQGKLEIHGLQNPLSENTILGNNKGIAVSEAVVKSNIDAIKSKTDYITVNQAVDLDTLESDTVINNAKVSNATHTGEVTGATALTVDKTAITGKAAVTPATDDYILISDTSDSGNLKKALISGLPSGGSSTAQVVSATLGSTQTNYAISGLSTSSGVTTYLYVTPSTSFTLQSLNLTGVEDGKTIIIINSTVYNASAARAFIIENNNGASGTKFLYANNGVPLLMTPGGISRFVFTGGFLRLVSSTCFGESPNACFDYFDDMLWTMGSNIAPAWKSGGAGTSSIVANTTFTIPTDINPMGVLGISTASATAIGSLLLQTQSLLQGGRGFATFLGRATPDTTLSTGSDTWIDYLGFINGDGTAVSNAVGWKYDAATVGNWFTVTALNSTETTTTGQGPTANVNEMPYLGVFINGDWTNVEYFFSVDGVTWTFCATAHTTNIPTASNRLFSVGASRRRTAGTATRILAIDILSYTYRALRTV